MGSDEMFQDVRSHSWGVHIYIFLTSCTPTYDILNEDIPSNTRGGSITHTACKDEFRQKLRSHSWMERFGVFTLLIPSIFFVVSTFILSFSLSQDVTQVRGHSAGYYLPPSPPRYAASLSSREDATYSFPRRLASIYRHRKYFIC